MRKARQHFGLDAPHGKLCHTGHALHGLGDGQNVARAHRAVGVAVALKGVTLQRRHGRRLDGGHGQVNQLAGRRHVEQLFMHPAAGGNGLERVTNGNAVAQYRLPGTQITQRHLVALRHTLGQHQPAGQDGARRQAAVIANDGHVVTLVHANDDGGGAGV